MNFPILALFLIKEFYLKIISNWELFSDNAIIAPFYAIFPTKLFIEILK